MVFDDSSARGKAFARAYDSKFTQPLHLDIVMKIAFIGYGLMATALATKWQHGHQLFFAGRNLEKAEQVAKAFNASSGNSSDAVKFADVVVLATRCEDVFSAIESAGSASAFAGKTVIDINNPVNLKTFITTMTNGRSLTEAIQDAIPDAQIIKAFNTDQASVWRDEDMCYGGIPKVTLYTADSPAAEAIGAQLINDVGSTPLLIGGQRNAYQLEALAAMTIKQLFGSAPSTTIFQYIERP